LSAWPTTLITLYATYPSISSHSEEICKGAAEGVYEVAADEVL